MADKPKCGMQSVTTPLSEGSLTQRNMLSEASNLTKQTMGRKEIWKHRKAITMQYRHIIIWQREKCIHEYNSALGTTFYANKELKAKNLHHALYKKKR